jgi:hypothetical protein
MKIKSGLIAVLFIMLTAACGPSDAQVARMVSEAQTGTAAAWTKTFTVTVSNTPTLTDTPSLTYTPTFTFTPSLTYTPTETFTATSTPTNTATSTFTFTPTFTASPTFDFPRVVVDQKFPEAACMWGPSQEYLWGWDLKAGDHGIVYGRSPYNGWLYVKMTITNLYTVDKYCWIGPQIIDITGDPKRVRVEDIEPHMPFANNLYAAPKNVSAKRDGDKVIISWSPVWMTQDDDRGYFIDAKVCQNGYLVWVPKGRLALPNQWATTLTLTDERGCSEPSSALLYTVEKHGYTNPVSVPWPR